MKYVTLRNGWRVYRVTEADPCRVCAKGDWCVHIDGGGSLCQRVESPRRVGDAGWYHPDGGGHEPTRVEPPRDVPPDYGGMLRAQRRYVAALSTDDERWRELVGDVGVDEPILRSLGVGWSAEAGAYSWPMRDGDGRIVGIRYRALNGRKWALPGSRGGLFIAENDPLGMIMMPEGPSDTAVLRELGFSVWGRPDSRSSHHWARHRLLKMRKVGMTIDELVVIGDDDSAGISGAETFASQIARAAPMGVRVLIPPRGMDIRQWVDDFAITAPMLSAYAKSRELIHG